MPAKLIDWFAGVREHRIAAIIAIAGSLLLALLLIAPSAFQPQYTSVKTRIKPHAPAYKLPHRHTQKSPITLKTRDKSVSPTSIRRQTKKVAHGYYVQTGAFKKVERAEKVVRSLQHTDWHVQIIVKKNSLHTVLIGPWSNRARAKAAKQKLARRNKLQGFIVRE